MDAREAGAGGGGFAEVWRIAVPLILGMASYTVMQFTDRVFLSRYSGTAIQAALPAGALANAFTCFWHAAAAYAGAFTAQYHGAKRHGDGARAAAQGIWIALLSWPLIALTAPLGEWLIGLFGHAPEVVAAERAYFGILVYGGVTIVLNAAGGGYFMGIGRTDIYFAANTFGCGINILLNYIMIFGHWGCPRMGIEGAAWATLASGLLAFLLQLALMLARRFPAGAWRLDWRLLGRILRFGAPSGLQSMMDIGSFAVFTMLAGRLGALAQTACSVAFSVNTLAFAPLLGFGMAASTVVGHHMGAGEPGLARKAGEAALKLGLAYMALIGLTFILLPRAYFALFSPAGTAFSAEELLGVGRVLLWIMAGWGLFDSVNIVIGGALKGAGDTRFVMIAMVAAGWLLLVPGVAALLHFGAGTFALCGWMAFYIAALAACFAWRWRAGKWMAIRMIER